MTDIPNFHNEIVALNPGGPETLSFTDKELTPPGPEQILIKTVASGLNRADILQRQGLYPPPKGVTMGLGLECSGTVISLGDGVTEFKVGDAVCALLAGGGYSDYVLAHEGSVLPAPKGVSLEAAAGLPEATFTVFRNVFNQGALFPEDRFLVHGGTSGIGVYAIQMAKAKGAEVYATAGTDEKCQACLDVGADHAINYRTEDFEAVVAGKGGVDVILDMVGGDYVQKNLNILREFGTLVNIAFMAGAKVEVHLLRLMLKRLTFTGSTLRANSDNEKATLALEVENTVWPWIEQGKVKPIIDRVFDRKDVVKAHQYLEAGGHIGKILLWT